MVTPGGYGWPGMAFWTSCAMVCASKTTASPPIAANAASLALSMRRGLPPAVMYKKPAQARNSAAAARPTLVAASSSVLNISTTDCGLLIECPFGLKLAEPGSCGAYPAAAREVVAPEAAENRLDGDHLTFGWRVDL